jgi:hypothetical protein
MAATPADSLPDLLLKALAWQAECEGGAETFAAAVLRGSFVADLGGVAPPAAPPVDQERVKLLAAARRIMLAKGVDWFRDLMVRTGARRPSDLSDDELRQIVRAAESEAEPATV